MKRIPLSQGQFALVDDVDYDWLNQFNWYATRNGKNGSYLYARRDTQNIKTIFMHREILKLKRGDGINVDHIDGNGLNNQRGNLRHCTKQQNKRNSVSHGGTSKHKGVSWCGTQKKWRAQIGIERKTIYLGRYIDEAKAAKAYDVAALKYFKKFARLNFPILKRA